MDSSADATGVVNRTGDEIKANIPSLRQDAMVNIFCAYFEASYMQYVFEDNFTQDLITKAREKLPKLPKNTYGSMIT